MREDMAPNPGARFKDKKSLIAPEYLAAKV
jgi:hypothetical protein